MSMALKNCTMCEQEIEMGQMRSICKHLRAHISIAPVFLLNKLEVSSLDDIYIQGIQQTPLSKATYNNNIIHTFTYGGVNHEGVSSTQGEVSCSGTPQHSPARRRRGSKHRLSCNKSTRLAPELSPFDELILNVHFFTFMSLFISENNLEIHSDCQAVVVGLTNSLGSIRFTLTYFSLLKSRISLIMITNEFIPRVKATITSRRV